MSQELINKTLIAEHLMREAPWSGSHGADQDYLGGGLLYYALVYSLKARVAVCLGSGGGFVPRLMRQAQRDLGIASTSRTILVDGNRPERGWGAPVWLDANSFFRRSYPDVEIIVDLTTNAARNFRALDDFRIDYLHIDADHSFEACLGDFEAYRPLLHAGTVVTLHDTNFPASGVKHVVEHVRTLADCEVIAFDELGVGLALVRVTGEWMGPRFKPASPEQPEGSGRIGARRRAGARPAPPPFKEWKYLESPAFSTRYILAAHFVRSCRCVIEIGGGRTPIDHFLAGPHDCVLVIDPFIAEKSTQLLQGAPCAVSHLRARFQDIDWQIPAEANYGLVMLGLDIQGLTSEDYQTLYRLVDRATVTVVEFPTSWGPSREQFDLIRNNSRTTETFSCKLNLEGNDFGNLANSWPPRCDREIHVLQPR